jgi:hypothetical protein
VLRPRRAAGALGPPPQSSLPVRWSAPHVVTEVDTILRGATPEGWPGEQRTTGAWVIHLKTAHALGLLIPQRPSATRAWRKHGGSPAVALMHEMHPLIRGWSTSFRTGVSKEVFAALDGFMDRRAQRSMQRRHPRQSGWWRTQKYGGQVSGRQDRWVLQEKERHGPLRKVAWAKIIRHRLVPTTSSPDDSTLQDYRSQRRQRLQVTTGCPGHLAWRHPGAVRSATRRWTMRPYRTVAEIGPHLGAEQVLRISLFTFSTGTLP